MTPARAEWHFKHSVGNAVIAAELVPSGTGPRLGLSVTVYPFKRAAAFLWVLWRPNGAGTVLSTCVAGGMVRTALLEDAAIAAMRALVRKRNFLLARAA
jgi:hypothetical protein